VSIFTVILSRYFPVLARISLHPATRLLNCCNLSQMNKEGVEHIEFEKDPVRRTNNDIIYNCLSTTNKLLQPVSFGHSDTSTQMSKMIQITEKFFKMIFSLQYL